MIISGISWGCIMGKVSSRHRLLLYLADCAHLPLTKAQRWGGLSHHYPLALRYILNWTKQNQPALYAILQVDLTLNVVPQIWNIRNGLTGCPRGLIMFSLFWAASQKRLSNGICDICRLKWWDLKSSVNGLGRRPGCKSQLRSLPSSGLCLRKKAWLPPK